MPAHEQEQRRDLGSAERNDVRDRLLACNAPQLAAAYEAAVALLGQPDFPARRHLLSHLVRDIAEGLPEAVAGHEVERVDTTPALDDLKDAWRRGGYQPAPFAAAETPPPTGITISVDLATRIEQLVSEQERVELNKRDKFALLIDALRPGSQGLRSALEPILREWVGNLRWFQGQAHVPRKPTDGPEAGELERRFRNFEAGLRGILAGHFEVTHEIDEILATHPSPDAATLDKLTPLLAGAQQIRHFFERLDNPAWLQPLQERRYFAKAPGAVVHEQPGGVTSTWYPLWPASRFLARIAEHEAAQEQVAEIACKLDAGDNPWVHRDVADIALRLAPARAARLVPRLIGWLPMAGGGWFGIEEQLVALAARLAEAGERKRAQDLLQALVKVPDPPRGESPRLRVDDTALEQAFEKHLAPIVAGLRLDALGILSSALAKVVQLTYRDDPNNKIEDYSDAWRPAVEDSARHDARDVLVTAVQRAAVQLAQLDPTLIARVVECLEKRPRLIFRRLALYTLWVAPAPPRNVVAPRLLDRTLFDRFTTCREYRMLLERGFPLLSEAQQCEWLAWVEAGIAADAVRARLEFLRPQQPVTEQAIQEDQRRWQWIRLGPVAGSLRSPWRERFQALGEDFGSPAPAAQLSPVHVGAVGWPSPLSLPEARAMTPADLAHYCRAPLAAENPPWPEGIESVISVVVQESPRPYADEALVFRGLQPFYVTAFFEGWATAVRARREFAWPRVFDLAAWAVAQRSATESTWEAGQYPGWTWTRRAVIDLLSCALAQQPCPLLPALRENVWSLLGVLCADPDPELRGRALETSVRYAEWVRVSNGEAGVGQGTLDDVPEVRIVIDAALAAAIPRLHEALGRELSRLIGMDEAWIRVLLPRLFPSAPEQAALREAAWRAYLRAPVAWPSERVFHLLVDLYAEAIERLKSIDEPALMAGDVPERRLAQHLTVLYGRGALEAHGAMALLDRFFECAHIALRWHFHWYVGESLGTSPATLPPDVVPRFQQLWQRRRDRAATDGAIREELPLFGEWFVRPVFDADWRLAQLEFVLQETGRIAYESRVAAVLAELAPQRTVRVMQCCALAVERMPGERSVTMWSNPGSIQTILGAALRSGDPTAREQAIATFHRLGSLGFRAHELVPFSNDLDDPAAIAYFTWDHPMTVAEIRQRLSDGSQDERYRMLGQILREAKPPDVWRFTTPQEVATLWPQIEKHLGRHRDFWDFLLTRWRKRGFLAAV